MKRFRAVIIILSLLLSSICGVMPAAAAPKRIVSFTPVGTEILFALGQDSRLIGVTTFCDYPPEVSKKPKIGGYAEINFEALLAKQVDLAVLQDMHRQYQADLKRLGIPFVVVRQESIREITDSVTALGKLCGADKRAAQINENIRASVASVRGRVKGAAAPRVLVCVSRELTEPHITTFYAAGPKSFYDEIVRIAGGRNVVTDKSLTYPKVSQEGLAALAPDVIIDLVGERKYYHSADRIDLDKVFNQKYLRAPWLAMPSLKGARICVLDGTVYLRPGPRLPKILEAFSAAIHPGAK